MARKPRAEVEGGLYHVITRGNNRRQIFNSPADYKKFLLLLAVQKTKLPFLLTDQLGTPRVTPDKTGSLAAVERHDYLPFGDECLNFTPRENLIPEPSPVLE